jgi:hypothetical protein
VHDRLHNGQLPFCNELTDVLRRLPPDSCKAYGSMGPAPSCKTCCGEKEIAAIS